METITSAPAYERLARWRDFERTSHGVRFHAETSAGTPVEVALDFVLPEVVRLRMSPENLGPARTPPLSPPPMGGGGGGVAALPVHACGGLRQSAPGDSVCAS